MKKSWFQHFPMNETEANLLVNQYSQRGVKTEKHLTADPRFYVVTAFLPYTQYPPKSQKSLRNNRLWGKLI